MRLSQRMLTSFHHQELRSASLSTVERAKCFIVRSMTTSAVSARRQRTRDPVLAAVARLGTTTRAELSRLTGLSRSAVGDCVAALLADGVLVEAVPDTASGGRGRRAATLRMRPAPGVVLGV